MLAAMLSERDVFERRTTRELLLHADPRATVPIPICSIVYPRWKHSSALAKVTAMSVKSTPALPDSC